MGKTIYAVLKLIDDFIRYTIFQNQNPLFSQVWMTSKGRGWKEVSAILVVGGMGRIGHWADKDIGLCPTILSEEETWT